MVTNRAASVVGPVGPRRIGHQTLAPGAMKVKSRDGAPSKKGTAFRNRSRQWVEGFQKRVSLVVNTDGRAFFLIRYRVTAMDDKDSYRPIRALADATQAHFFSGERRGRSRETSEKPEF